MPANNVIRVLSVDDHPLLSEGIAAMINGEPDMQLVGATSRGEDGIVKHRELRPDVTLMDLRLPDCSGIEAMRAIFTEFSRARIILLTMFAGDVEIQRALEAGAQAYLLKSMSPEQMIDTIRQVHAGKKRVLPEIATHLAEHLSDERLTDRELDVLHHAALGNRNRDIAEKLYVSEHTVKVHIQHILGKLGAVDRTHAIAIAARRGFIQL